jgi:transcriptional regulator with XRE-family HTH domain
MLVEAVHREQAAQNWTDGETATVLGLSRQSWSDIQRGRRAIGKKVQQRILERLGLNQDEVWRPELTREGGQPMNGEIYKLMSRIQTTLLDLHARIGTIEATLQQLQASSQSAKPHGRRAGMGDAG